jgi:hypothetical protein
MEILNYIDGPSELQNRIVQHNFSAIANAVTALEDGNPVINGYILLGPDATNGSWRLVDSGTGNCLVQKYITSAWVTQFSFIPGAVNSFTVTGGATNSPVQLQAIGTDAAISIQISAKGDGVVLLGGYGGVEATAGAATATSQRGYVTTEALTTAGLAAYTLTLTNAKIKANSFVVVGVEDGTNTQGTPVVGRVKVPSAGSATIEIRNVHATQALNGTLLISFAVL